MIHGAVVSALSHDCNSWVQSVAPNPLALRIVNRVIPRYGLHACGTDCLLFFFPLPLNSSTFLFPSTSFYSKFRRLLAYEVETFSHTAAILAPSPQEAEPHQSQRQPDPHFMSLNWTTSGFSSKPWGLGLLAHHFGLYGPLTQNIQSVCCCCDLTPGSMSLRLDLYPYMVQ